MAEAARPPTPVRNLLLVRLSSIGDVIFALPALEVLRAHYPEARITWVVEDRAAAVLEDHPLLDEVIVAPRREWRRIRAERGHAARLSAMRSFFRALKARRFDVSIDFQGNLKSGLFSWQAGAALRFGLGRDECKEPNWLFTNRRLPLGGRVMHRIERDLHLITQLGIPYEFRWPRVADRPADRAVVDTFLAQCGPRTGPLVVLNPGTSAWFKSKRWPTESYAALGDALVRRRGATIVLNHGPGEDDLVAAIRSGMEERAHVSSRVLSLLEVGALVRQADLVVGSDTGPTHLAAALRRPVIALFGPYDPRHSYPYQHPERAHFAAIPCSPCRYRGCPAVDCMRLITPGEVLERCEGALDGTPQAPHDLIPNKTVPV